MSLPPDKKPLSPEEVVPKVDPRLAWVPHIPPATWLAAFHRKHPLAENEGEHLLRVLRSKNIDPTGDAAWSLFRSYSGDEVVGDSRLELKAFRDAMASANEHVTRVVAPYAQLQTTTRAAIRAVGVFDVLDRFRPRLIEALKTFDDLVRALDVLLELANQTAGIGAQGGAPVKPTKALVLLAQEMNRRATSKQWTAEILAALLCYWRAEGFREGEFENHVDRMKEAFKRKGKKRKRRKHKGK